MSMKSRCSFCGEFQEPFTDPVGGTTWDACNCPGAVAHEEKVKAFYGRNEASLGRNGKPLVGYYS
jgi:hypothetical protein